MRKILLTTIALSSLVLVGAVAAKTVTVSITKNGYVPSTHTIAVGDTVQFTNGDTVAHQVTFKTTTGVRCSPSPLVLQPAQAGSCTFAAPGSFTYSDPNVRGNTYRGSITVTGTAPAAGLTLAARPAIVVYGNKTTLSGTLSSQRAGENVDVWATACGKTAAKVATVQTTTGGAYVAGVKPLLNTAYTVRVKNTTSPAVTVRVRPRVRLAKVAPKRYTARVFATRSFAGKSASFQRYNGTLRRWVTVKRVLLRASSTGVAPTVITTAAFRSTLPAGTRLRVTLPQLLVGSCHAPGLSNVVVG
jgi:plastocyanin